MTDQGKVYIFGDSVMKGVVLDEGASRYRIATQALWHQFAELSGRVLENRSMFGCTITKAQAVITRTLKRANDCAIAVLEFGGNDCNFDWPRVCDHPDAAHEPATPPDQFMATYETIVRALQAQGIQVIILNLPPVDGETYLNYLVTQLGLSRDALLRFLGDSGRISRFQELYSRFTEQVATRTGAVLVDIRSRFLEVTNYRAHMCADGLHPSRAGHGLIYDAFVAFIDHYDGPDALTQANV